MLDLNADVHGAQRQAYCPITVEQAIAFRQASPQAKIVAGATDVGVQLNKRVIEPAVFLDLNRVVELEGVKIEAATPPRPPHKGRGRNEPSLPGLGRRGRNCLQLCQSEVPEFAEIVSVFGSPQIRHVGTIGGNIINASPIADSGPFLFVMDAELELAGPQGRRTVNINRFYHGYKKFDLRPDELLTGSSDSFAGQR